MTKIVNLGPPLLSPDSLKLERYNFTCVLRLSATIEIAQEFSPKGACSESRDQNCKFGTPLLSPDSLKLERYNFTCLKTVEYCRNRARILP